MNDHKGSTKLFVFGIITIVAAVRMTKIENDAKQSYLRGLEDGRVMRKRLMSCLDEK